MKIYIKRARSFWPRRRNQPWRAHIVFDNGRSWAHTERYTNKADILSAIETAREEMLNAVIIDERP